MSLALIARCTATGRLGIAAASEWPFLGFAAICVRSGLGASVAMGAVNRAGRALPLNLLAQGFTPAQALAQALDGDPDRAHRQLALLSATAGGAAVSGDTLKERAGAFERIDADVIGIGHSAAVPQIAEAALEGFRRAASERFDHRLIAALEAARDAGAARAGMRRIVYRSAAVLVHGSAAYSDVDMRVDARENAIDGLREILGEQDLFDRYFEERRRNPNSTEMADEFVARMKHSRPQTQRQS